jgi:excisionase family DNA binding protein
MENVILYSIPPKDLRDLIGNVLEEKLQQFRPAEPQQTNTNGEYLTRKEVCNLLRISLSTLHYYTKDGTLQGYRIAGRILYRKVEVNNAVQSILSTKYKHHA